MIHIISDTTATFFINNNVISIKNDHPYWNEIIEATKQNNETKIAKLANIKTAIEAQDTALKIKNDTVFYNDKPLHNAITKRIIKSIKEGFNPTPLKNFLENVLQNPSNRAIEQLYTFLETNNLPIAEDGTFVAYKKVRFDWLDCHSSTIDNSIGKTVSMPRNEVDDNPNNTCSHGLHICSLGYLNHFSGDRLIAVKVNPKNVVSVPVDYENTKMRVCEYTILQELDIATIPNTDAEWNGFLYNTPESIEEEEEEEEKENTFEFAPIAMAFLHIAAAAFEAPLTPQPNESTPFLFVELTD